jgi:hypothetical protein
MEDNRTKADSEVIKKLLASVPSGQPEEVGDVELPEPWLPSQVCSLLKALPHGKGTKRGPKSDKEWNAEIRKAWGHLHDEIKIAESWLASLEAVQDIAASRHGGRTIGQGLALQELLKKALVEVQQYDMEEKTREILRRFPDMKMKKIASQLGLDRSQVSRNYTRKAVSLLTKAFQRVIDQANSAPSKNLPSSSPFPPVKPAQ